MKSSIRHVLMMLAAFLLALAGMGSRCPGTSGKDAKFENPILGGLVSSVSFPRSWYAPMIIDVGAADLSSASLNTNQNVQSDIAGSPSLFPMPVFNDAAGQFYAIFNRASDVPPHAIPPNNIVPFVTGLSDISTTQWVTGLGDFTQLDVSTDALRSVATVDSGGNATVVTVAKLTAMANYLPRASRHNYDSGAWTTSVSLSDPAVAADVSSSLAIGSDSANNTVVAWAQNGDAYFNEFRPNLGWRFQTGSTWTTWHSAGTTTVNDYGMDVGFDSKGNGYGVYSGTVGGVETIVVGRWRSDRPERFSTSAADFKSIATLTGPTYAPYPKLAVMPDGSATVFYFDSFNAAAGAQLWYSTAPAPSGNSAATFATASRLDSATGSTSEKVFMYEATQLAYYPLSVSVAGSKAAIAYVKMDTNLGVKRAYVHTNSSNWALIGAADPGTLTVTSVDVAVNSKGEVAVVFSAIDPNDSLEHVYANNYIGGSWQGVTQLDFHENIDASAAFSQPFPRVSIDSAGNAICVFSMLDNIFATARRRVITSIYR